MSYLLGLSYTQEHFLKIICQGVYIILPWVLHYRYSLSDCFGLFFPLSRGFIENNLYLGRGKIWAHFTLPWPHLVGFQWVRCLRDFNGYVVVLLKRPSQTLTVTSQFFCNTDKNQYDHRISLPVRCPEISPKEKYPNDLILWKKKKDLDPECHFPSLILNVEAIQVTAREINWSSEG